MKAVILAGGRGTRLKPYTTVFPKPLVPIGEYPVVEILIRQLSAQGINDITLTVGYLAELLKAYFLQRPSLTAKVQIAYVSEETPTGTAGSLALVPGLQETFLVMNGDVLTTLSFQKLIAYHHEQKAALTIAVHKKHVDIDLGVLVADQDGLITDYREKPKLDYLVSMGIYVYEPHVLRYIKAGVYLDFPDLVLKLIGAGERVVGYHSDDIWLDIGRPEDYQKAVDEFENHQAEFCANFDPAL
ncbi:MAG: sugar phosphate nucleotidyltransferase [Pyrinomonadaceae bacterium]